MTTRSGDDRPTVLLLGRGEAMLDAIAGALERHAIAVEKGETDHAVDAVFVGAPDLVVLVGDAAEDEGSAVLAKLAANVATAVVPVALLADDASLDHRLSAFRWGAVALVERSASSDAMARRIAELARELPERRGESAGELGEASLDEVVALFSRRLRSGILSVTAPGVGPDAAARIVLRGDRPVTAAIEEFVERIRPLVGHSDGEPLRFEFQESPTGKVGSLELDDEPSGALDPALFTDRRIVLVERSAARADDLVQSLRDRGAHVVVLDGEGTGLGKARAIDPDVIIVEADGLGGWASGAMRAIRRDARLRWASLLVVRGHELWPEGAPEPDIDRLGAGLRPLIAPDEAITARARDQNATFDLRLETTGPARMLRALARAQRTLHVTVRHRRATVDIDIAEGLLVGAVARSEEAGELGGSAALAALVALGSGRVRIEAREVPAVANVMSPIDDALAAADREAPPLRPSLPPPSLPPPPSDRAATPSVPITRSNDPAELVKQLEGLLDKLRASLPDDAPASVRVPREPVPREPLPREPVPRELAASAALPRIEEEPTRDVSLDIVPKKRATSRTIMGVAVPAPLANEPQVFRGEPKVPVPVPKPSRLPAVPMPAARGKRAPTTALSEHPFEKPAPQVVHPPEPAFAPAAIAAPVATVPPPVVLSTPSVMIETDDSALDRGSPPLSQSHAVVEPLPNLIADALASAPSIPAPPSLAAGAASWTDDTPDPVFVADASPITAPMIAPAPRIAAVEEITLTGRKPRSPLVWLAPLVVLATFAIMSAGAWWAYSTGRIPGMRPAAVVQTLPVVAPPVVPGDPSSIGAPPLAAVVVDAGALVAARVEPGPDPEPVVEPIPEPEPVVIAEVEPEPIPEPVVEPEPEAPEEEPEAEGSTAVSARQTEVEELVSRANYRRTHGELQAAEVDYLRVLRLQSTNPRAMAGLTRLHMARHDPRAATQWARRLVETRPTQPGNHLLLGDVLQMAGDHAGARRAWQQALALSPNFRDAQHRLDHP